MNSGARPPLEDGVLRVLRPDGEASGAGFLVTDLLAVTCAHVVAHVADPAGTGARVRVAAGLAERSEPVTATVRQWLPEPDVAVLELDAPLPDARPVPVVETGDDLWGHPARTVGFPHLHQQGIWHAGVLRQRQGNGWLQFERAADSGYSVGRGFSGAPVWDDALAAVIGMVVAVDAGHPVAFLIPTSRLLQAAPSLRAAVGLPSPFPGLHAFQEGDAEVFFGRETETERIAQLVLETPVVTVFGASGCGKSSLVRAGVVPRLRRAGFATVVLREGPPQDILDGLATELTVLTQPELRGSAQRAEIRAARQDLVEGRLADLVSQLRAAGDVRGLVVVVDQLEELLAGEASVAKVLFPESPPAGLRVLTTLRADFLEAVEGHPVLRRALRGNTFLLAPMTAAQLREAVVRPVERVPAVSYQQGLAERILADTGDAPGVLPLLGYTLDRLWQEQRAGLLTQEAYTRLGGVHGALARRAEEVWRRLVGTGDDAEQHLRRLFARLIRLPLGTRSAVRRTAVRSELTDGEWSAAQSLARERLLVIGVTGDGADRVETVELAHEALITAWPRLREWVERDQAFLIWREQLRQDRERWAAAGRPDDLLPGATVLEAATRWESERRPDLDAFDLDFLRRGRARVRRHARRRRQRLLALSAAVTVIAVLASLFVYQRQVSRDRQAESNSRALAAAAKELLGTDPPLAMAYALAAYRAAPTDTARDSLLQAHLSYPAVDVVMSGAIGGVRRIAASRDGRTILTVGMVGRATLFLRDDAGRIRREPLPFREYAGYPFVSRDGKRVGYVSTLGTLVWYDIADRSADDLWAAPEMVSGPRFSMYGQSVLDLRRLTAVSADGDQVVALSLNGRLVRWDLAARTRADIDLSDFYVEDMWFGPDRDTLLAKVLGPASTGGRQVLTIDLRSGKFRQLVKGVRGATVSGDGSTLAFCRGDAIQMTDATDATVRATIRRDPGDVSCKLALDDTGRYVSYGLRPPSVFRIAGDGTATKLAEIPGNPLTEDRAGGTYEAILGAGDQRFVLVATSTALALLEQPMTPEKPVVSAITLTPDGDRTIRYTDDGRYLRVYEASGAERELATVERQGATVNPRLHDAIPVSGDSALMVDKMAEERLVVRDTETLRPLADIHVSPLPEKPHPEAVMNVWYRFDGSGHLLTVSGAVLERWNARTGERTDRVDLGELGLLSDDPQNAGLLQAFPYPREGHVAVTNGGSEIRVVDLRSGREVSELRIDTGDGITAVTFGGTGRMVVGRFGYTWELWRTDPPRREAGPTDMCGGCRADDVPSFRLLPDGRFLVASGSGLRVYHPGSAVPTERYDFGREGHFIGVTGAGPTVVYGPRGELWTWSMEPWLSVVALNDVPRWRDELCRRIGWAIPTELDLGPATIDLAAEPLCEQPPAAQGSPDTGPGR